MVQVPGRVGGSAVTSAAPLMRGGVKFPVRVIQCTLNAFPARSNGCVTRI